MSIFKRVFNYFYNAPSKYAEPITLPDGSVRDCNTDALIKDTAEMPVQRTLRIEQCTNGIGVYWDDNEAIIMTYAVTANTLRAYLSNGPYYVSSSHTAIPVQYLTHSQERETIGRLIELLVIDGIIRRNGNTIELAENVTLN